MRLYVYARSNDAKTVTSREAAARCSPSICTQILVFNVLAQVEFGMDWNRVTGERLPFISVRVCPCDACPAIS
jgi:hypothetical protein